MNDQNLIDTDDVRARDLTPFGLFMGAVILLLGAGGVYEIGQQIVAGNVTNVLFGLFLALFLLVLFGKVVWDEAAPEVDEPCENCGEHIVANSGDDDTTKFVIVRGVGEPDRVSIKGFSFVVSPTKDERVYCSPGCAAEDTFHIDPADATLTTDERGDQHATAAGGGD
jgi:hypothetical protein